MSESATGQVTSAAAEVYEEYFVPALFQEWAPRLVAAADIRAGHRVLDVACGTGVLARAAHARVGPAGSVTGIDVNEGMLAVARRLAPEIDWRHGRAEALPLERDSLDAVVSQFGLMFFEDRTAALQEMLRVLRPGGHLAVAVWDATERSPGYATLIELLGRLFGHEAAQALRAPFVLGDPSLFRAVLRAAGLPEADIATEQGAARFPSIASWMHTEIRGWTLADQLDDAQFTLLLREAERTLQPFTAPDGTVEFAAPAHIATTIKA